MTTANGWPSSTASQRPGTTSVASTPRTIVFKSRLEPPGATANPAATAATTLYALCRHTSGDAIESSPTGVRTRSSVSHSENRALAQNTSAPRL